MFNEIGKVWVKEGLDGILDFINILEYNQEAPELKAEILDFLKSDKEYKDLFPNDLKDPKNNTTTIIRVFNPHGIIIAENREVLESYYNAKKEGLL